MELVRYIHNLKSQHRGCVITIGNFDGVHIGHQAVINQLQEHAARTSLPRVVMMFEPHPLEYFNPGGAPPRLTSFRDKVQWLAEHDIDRVVCLRFQKLLAEMPAETFVSSILIDKLGARIIVIGDDFRFGKDRGGDFALLESMQGDGGFDVISTQTLLTGGERVSSSRIRNLLTNDRFDEAALLLGRPFSISGRVIHGDKRGRQLGIATANLALKRERSPIQGVFAVSIHGTQIGKFRGVANIGNRPVFSGEEVLLEVHILDFDKDIYGDHLQVDFHHKLRAEQKFASVDELVVQIRKDIEQAREYFETSEK